MRTWIFQGNPDVFDIEGYLANSSGLITWTVSRYSEQISPGDTVYLWRSQGHEPKLAGIVAEGTVVERPKAQLDDVQSTRFWKGSPGQEERMRVKLRINRIAKRPEILRREWMTNDSILRNLSIMRQAAGTNFPGEEAEAKRIGQLWRKIGTDWTKDEVVAAIWLYERLRNKPISKIAGSEVELLSQQIGRVPSGVYNKLMNLRSLDPTDDRKGLEGGSDIDELTWGEFFDAQTAALDVHRLDAEFERLWGNGIKSEGSVDEVLLSEERRLAEKPLDWFQKHYAERPQNTAPGRRSQETLVYDRDPFVIAYRKHLAGNRCEVRECQSEQFRTTTGELFVEVHHLVPLAEGGSDVIENTAAVCPTHHRLLHHGRDRQEIANQLFEKRRFETSILSFNRNATGEHLRDKESLAKT